MGSGFLRHAVNPSLDALGAAIRAAQGLKSPTPSYAYVVAPSLKNTRRLRYFAWRIDRYNGGMSAITNRIAERARFHSLALSVWALFLIAGLVIGDDYGVPPYAGGQRFVAIDTINYVLHGDHTLLQIAADRFYGTAFELPLFLLERALGLEDPHYVYLARHVLTHLLFLIGGFCCYLLARRLAGDRLVALLVMLLFLLSPRLYAHSFFNSKDPVFASAFVMALLFASRAFDRDSLGAYRWGGMAAGLLVNLRIMGVVLFAVVLVFRAWAWFRAGGGAARRRVVATTGAFALWGGLVLFISLPYLWGDPAGRLSEYWTVLADHPVVQRELFRGQAFSGAALPWDYMLHWFAISQPPVTLLLGLLGLGALGLAAGGVVRRGAGAGPGRGLDAAELRFGVLLATCFVLPLVVFVLLRPNTINGWRHFYFLHGPFCLLATFALMGLRQLPARGLRKGWLGGVACALTAAGLGAAALEMAQIHPHQYLYFNFFVDRKTPERLSERYETDYWNMMLRQGYEHILRQTPASTINMRPRVVGTAMVGVVGAATVADINRNVQILPAAARSRFTFDPARDPDFYLGGNAEKSFLPKDPFSPILHRIKVYNNTIMTISTPDLSRVDPAVADEYRALHRAATAREPVARGGGFDVHLHGDRLAWVKEACEPGKLMSPFRLRFYPADAGRLPNHLRKQGYFATSVRGVRFDGKCLGARRLPDFALTRARLGQRGRWEADIPF